VRISRAMSVSVIKQRTRRRPPHGHANTSAAKTRRSRSAHGSRVERRVVGAGGAGRPGWAAGSATEVAASARWAGARVTTRARSFALGANTPA
jgi:hypothetical protein